MRTSEQIKAEIEEKFGFVPPFFGPAQQNPQVFENLWQQTLFAYVNNPLSPLFKEKLSAYLSRHCAVPYCMICHSCSLRPLGVKAQEVLELLESPPPTEMDIDEHLRTLASEPDGLFLPLNSALEDSLLYCAIFISLERERTEYCRSELRRLLGAVNYQHLISFIAYVKTCHVWMEAHPEIAYEADKRVIDNLAPLVENEPGLAEFFRNYNEKVRRERQSWKERQVLVAERKLAEEALRKAAAENLRLARAIASVSDGVAISDPNQTDNPVIYSNPAFSQITGYEPEEIVGRNCRFLQGAGTAPEAIAQIKSAIAQRREVKVTLLNYRKDGQPFWNELKISPVFSDEGDLLYFVGIQTDITERKQAEESLRQSEQRFRFLTEAIPQQVWTAQPDGALNYFNQRVLDYFGRTFEEMVGWGWQDVLHPDDLSGCIERWSHSLSTGEPYEIEFRLLWVEKGTYRWHLGRALPLHDRGKIISWFGTNTDIDERKRAEEERIQLLDREQAARTVSEAAQRAAEAARKRTVKILESITDAFFTLDTEWRFTYLNSRAEQLLFKVKDELLDRCVWDEFPEAVAPTFYQECHRAVANKVTVHFEEFYPPLDTWFEVRAYPYQDGLSIYFRDVTARKQTEAMLMERSRLSALGAEIGIALGQSGTLSESLQRCTEAMKQHLDAALAAVWTFISIPDSDLSRTSPTLNPIPHSVTRGVFDPNENRYDSETNHLKLQASAALPGMEAILDSSIIEGITRNHQPYLTADVAHVLLGAQSHQEQEKPVAFAGYPLIIEERLVGVMVLLSCQPFTEAVHSMLGWVANGIAVAIDRAWAREELLSRREDLLFRLASQIRNSLDLDTILTTTVREIRSLLQIDRCYFLWYNADSNNPKLAVTHEAAHELLPSLLGELPSTQSVSWLSKIRNLETIRIDDITSEPGLDVEIEMRNFASLLSSLDITSQLLLPLETHSGQFGAVVCSHCSGPRPWSDSEVELLQAVVDQLAIAIEQAELYAQTRATALAAQTQARQLEIALQNLKQAQSQLIQTEKMSSLGQMVAGIAHEINNPVSFISGNISHANAYIQDLLDLLKLYQSHYPDTVAEIQDKSEAIDLEFLIDDLPMVLSSMKMGADRIRQIVLSLRNFSRLDEAEMKPVDIHVGIDNTLLILQNRLKPKDKHAGIQIVKEYGNLPLVECYAGQLNQVFMNVISNAIDALEESFIRSQLSVVSSKEKRTTDNGQIRICTELIDGNQVVIRIRDNGPGITESVKKQLFDPFFTTKPVGKGTGLGLSISYQIVVDKHGGIFKCISESGHGAEFWIQIPLAPLAKSPTLIRS